VERPSYTAVVNLLLIFFSRVGFLNCLLKTIQYLADLQLAINVPLLNWINLLSLLARAIHLQLDHCHYAYFIIFGTFVTIKLQFVNLKRPMAKIYRFILLVMLFVSTTLGAAAQVTTASISGRIMDSKGEPLPGANVLALHVPTGTKNGVSSRNDGRFNLPNLRVGGPYTLTVSFIGYQEQKQEQIYLSLGQTMTVEFTLTEESTNLGEVVVRSESSIFNSQRTGYSNNFSNDQIRQMPTITRSAADIYRLTPSSDGNSFAGRNGQYNNFSLNGTIFNNPFGLDAATPGGQTDAQPISLDAIDQIQVSIAPYDVTQAGFTGASVNAVTKSGANKLFGTVFGFYRNNALTGSKVGGQDIIAPKLSQFQSGFSIGGPIVKDKAFFFANFELERREDLGSNFLAARPGLSGENVARVQASDLDAVSSLLKTKYNYDTGPYENYFHNTNNQKGIVKLDWNISQKHTVSFIYNFLDAYKDKPAHPSAIGRRGPDITTLQFYNSGYRINNKINSGLVEFKSIFSNKFSNKLQIGMTSYRDSRDPFSQPFPIINIDKDGIRYIVAGHEPFSIHNVLNQDVFQINNNFDIYAGKHSITIGSSFEKFSFANSFNLTGYGFGVFGSFPSVGAFQTAVNSGSFDADVSAAQNTFITNNANNKWNLAELNVGQSALYAQDKWTASANFTLTYGIRMDMPLYFDTSDKIKENIARKGGEITAGGTYAPSIIYRNEKGAPVTFDQTKLPDQVPLFSPRVGFNWDVNGDRTLQVRGGTGLFTGRLPFVWIGNQVANPDFFFYCVTAPNFKFPQVWRTNLGIDKQLTGGWLLSADVIYTKDLNAMLVRNYGRSIPTGNLIGPDKRPIYKDADKVQFGGSPTNAYVFTNTNEGYSLNVTLEAKHKWENGLYASLAYNYLDSRDISSISAEISGDAYDRNPISGNANTPSLAPSLYGNKHRVVGSVNKTFKYSSGKLATTFSLFFEYAQGGRFNYTYSGDLNGDGSGLNDLIYIPTDTELQAQVFSGTVAEQSAQRTGLQQFINQDKYLKDRKGQYAEKYGILNPWYSRWDIRFLQDFKITETSKIQFSWDILNVGNLISSSWGVRQFPQNTQPIGVSVDAAGNPTYSFDPALKNTFTNDFSLLSRWQMQFGLRYIF
jgi:Carboxypeptidase regulatory-like domain